MVNGLQNLFTSIVNVFGSAIDAIGNTLSSLAQPIGYLVGVLAVFGSLIGIIWYVFRGNGGIGGLVGSIKGFFTGFL
jgi:Flp pilus assembly pilin Flp